MSSKVNTSLSLGQTTGLSSKARKILLRVTTDFEFFAANLLRIKTKSAEVVPLILNPAQKIMLAIIDSMIARHEPVRIIILKARQMGISTLIQAYLFWRCVTRPNRTHLTIAHESDATDNLFDMSKLFFDELPNWFRPMKRYSNKKELRFENPDDKTRGTNPGLRSKIIVQTAEKRGKTGRSFTFHGAHLSESTRWLSSEQAKLALKNSVPKNELTFVFDESTAKGIGGDFHDSYWKAKKNYSAGVEEENYQRYQAVFLAWNIDPDYAIPLTDTERRRFPLTNEERDLIKTHHLTKEQIKWRRDTIENECAGDPLLFAQEYPITDLEAFIAESESIFPQKKLQEQYLRAQAREESKDKGKRGYLVVDNNRKIRFVQQDYGYLTIYEMPELNQRYCMAADSAEGRDNKADFCTIAVFNAKSGNQAAQWHPIEQKHQPDLEELGKIMYMIGMFFNKALAAPEVNLDSTPTRVLRALSYPNIYKQTMWDTGRKEKKKIYGFRSTSRTKSNAIQYLKADIREDDITLWDLQTIQEFTTYIRQGLNKTGASEGCHDDRVTTAAICAYIREEVPEFKPKMRRPERQRIADLVATIKREYLVGA